MLKALRWYKYLSFPRESKISMYAYLSSAFLWALPNASQIIITVSTAHHKLHRRPLTWTPLPNCTHLTNHSHFVNVIFSIMFINGEQEGYKLPELKHTLVLLWSHGKEKVICSISISCYCFASLIMSSSIHIKFLFHQKTNKSICMNFRGSDKNTGPSVPPSWASFKFWLQLFIMSQRKTTK